MISPTTAIFTVFTIGSPFPAVAVKVCSLPQPENKTVTMEFAAVSGNTIMIKITDRGKGIEDIAKAMEPLFTTDTGKNRSGMGFTVMESFTDRLKVDSKPGQGTTVTMVKKLDTYYGF